MSMKKINFNSHAHVERDDNHGSCGHTSHNFNSHAHVERDFWNVFLQMISKISTHTLTWSVTAFS